MAHNGVKKKLRITVKRLQRIATELQSMARGNWTVAAIAKDTGIPERTVSRDLNHPAAAHMVSRIQERRQQLVDQLIQRQIKQIEAGLLKPHQQLFYRGQLISRLLPTKIVQAVKGEIEQKVEVEIPDLKGLDEDAVQAIVENFLEDEARRLRQEEQASLQGAEERPDTGLDPQG